MKKTLQKIVDYLNDFQVNPGDKGEEQNHIEVVLNMLGIQFVSEEEGWQFAKEEKTSGELKPVESLQEKIEFQILQPILAHSDREDMVRVQRLQEIVIDLGAAIDKIIPLLRHAPGCNINQNWDEAAQALADTPEKFRDEDWQQAQEELQRKRDTCTCGLQAIRGYNEKKVKIRP